MSTKILICIALLLKIISGIIGVLFIIAGIVIGVVGLSPDGITTSPYIRVPGLCVIILGILYIYPNAKIQSHSDRVVAYMSLTVAPFVILGLLSVIMIYIGGHASFLDRDQAIMLLCVLPVLLLPPASLVFYLIGKKYSVSDNKNCGK
jgi:hypothetical protein